MRTDRYDGAPGARRCWLQAFSGILCCGVLGGCCGLPLPSARFPNGPAAHGPSIHVTGQPTPAVSEPVQAVPAPAASAAAGVVEAQGEDSPLPPEPEPEPDPNPTSATAEPSAPAPAENAAEVDKSPAAPAPLPSTNSLPLGIPSQRVHETTQATPAPAIGGEPLIGLCAGEPCPPLVAVSKCNLHWRNLKLRRYLGPLFCGHAPLDEQALQEASLQPPFARFHPVPAAPVFAPRYDYEPPQLMMVPVPRSRHTEQMPGPFEPDEVPQPVDQD